jgi:hypothetical protein
MKKIIKIVLIMVSCAVIFGLGFGLWLLFVQNNVAAEAANGEQPGYTVESVVDSPFGTTVEPVEETMPELPEPTTEPIEPGLDLKRGSFLTVEIVQQLEGFAAEETIGGVWVGASSIVHGDTRAFVRVCMALEGSMERLMFGGPTWLDYPGGKVDAFFVHNDVPDEGDAACEVLEFVGVSPEGEGDWRFTMETVMFTIPDEGTECEVYQERAAADKALQAAGITAVCEHGEGMTTLGVASKPAGMSEAEAQKMVEDAVHGRHLGPWLFDLPMEVGMVQPKN